MAADKQTAKAANRILFMTTLLVSWVPLEMTEASALSATPTPQHPQKVDVRLDYTSWAPWVKED